MQRFPYLILILLLVLQIAGCVSDWKLDGTPSAAVEIGHPRDSAVGDPVNHPIEGGVYASGHPIIVEGFAQALYDANSGVVRVAVEIRDTGNADLYWDVAGAQPVWAFPPPAGPVPTFDAQLDPATGGGNVTWSAVLWDPQTAKSAGGSGSYSIQVTGYDQQDNAASSATIAFSVDNEAIPDP